MKKTLLLLTPFLLAGCSQVEQNRIDTANQYEEQKASSNPNSLFRVAETMKKSGNHNVSIKMYEQALQIDPTNSQARIGLSQSLRASGRNEAALEALKSVPAETQDVAWYKELGNVYTALNRPRLCIDTLKKANELDPRDMTVVNGIGVCNDLSGQHAEAQKYYRQAIFMAPSNTRLRSNMALSLSLSSKTKDAIEILTPIVESEHATTRDRQNLAIAYGLSGNMEKAAQLFSQDLSEGEVRNNLAFVHKLANSQHLIPEQKVDGVPVAEALVTNLAAEVDKKNEGNPSVETVTLNEKSLDSRDSIEVGKRQSTNEPQPVDQNIKQDTVKVPEKSEVQNTAPTVEEKPVVKAKTKKPVAAKKTVAKKTTQKKKVADKKS